MPLFAVLFFVGIVMLLFWAAKSSRHAALRAYYHTPAVARADDAVQILKARLAKGEITPEDYRKTLDLLK